MRADVLRILCSKDTAGVFADVTKMLLFSIPEAVAFRGNYNSYINNERRETYSLHTLQR